MKGLTTSLQDEAKDIVPTISDINTLTTSLKEIRENCDLYHTKWYEIVSEMCNKVGTAPLLHRLCGRQCHRGTTPASSLSEYFKRIISIPLLDHLLVKLEKRFNSHLKTAFQGLYVAPSLLVKEDFEKVCGVVLKMEEQYSGDLLNISSLRSEIHNWYTKWKPEEKEHG